MTRKAKQLILENLESKNPKLDIEDCELYNPLGCTVFGVQAKA